MQEKITPEQQMLVIEKLYRSTDSITSTKKFNQEFGEKVGKIGVKTLFINEFYTMIEKAGFARAVCKDIIKEITGHEPTIY